MTPPLSLFFLARQSLLMAAATRREDEIEALEAIYGDGVLEIDRTMLAPVLVFHVRACRLCEPYNAHISRALPIARTSRKACRVRFACALPLLTRQPPSHAAAARERSRPSASLPPT